MNEHPDLTGLPILICGMAGSRNGWVEVPYVACPAVVATIASGLRRAPTDKWDVFIVPGLVSTDESTGMVNVMRGEETQMVGHLKNMAGDATFILPGTHSKWVRVRGGEMTAFTTCMTGEVFHVMKTHSILGTMMKGEEHDERSFLRGVDRALSNPNLLELLFSVRTEGLFDKVPGEYLCDYLSGIVIGSEIRPHAAGKSAQPTYLVASGPLRLRYELALERAGFSNLRPMDGGQSSEKGLWEIRRHLS